MDRRLVLWRSREEALAAARAPQAGDLPAAVLERASAITEVESMTHGQVEHHVGDARSDGGTGAATTSAVDR